jgi:N-acetylglutamate synthase-like GNAT family acetyltransferase
MGKDAKIIIRKATRADEQAIHDLIHLVHINPMDLKWEHFLLAEDPEGIFLGCGQIKVHQGGVLELASIAVVPEARHQGIAGKIIQRLSESTPKNLYLTCRSRLETFYQPFGFEKVTEFDLLPGYFRRIRGLSNNLMKLKIINEPILVMYRNNE